LQECDCQSLRERVDMLEAQNRRHMKVGLVVLTIAACAMFMAQTTAKRTVEAEEFVLRDASGRIRGTWSTMEGAGASFGLRDESGKLRVMLTASPAGPSLVLADTNEKMRVGMAILDSTHEPGISLMGTHQEERASVYLAEGDQPSMSFRDANGKVRSEFVLGDKGPQYRLADANDQSRLTLGVSDKGPGFSLLDSTGKPQALFLGTQDGPWLALYDPQGRQVFSKP
jgi:hypothetical protein